jgi:hypothetical protein
VTPVDAFQGSEDEPRIALPRSGPSAVRTFWIVLLVLLAIGLMLSLAAGGEGFIVGVVIILLILPALQLAAAIVTLFVLALSTHPNRGRQLWQLGKIVMGVVIGTVLGIVVMWAIYLVMTHR